MRVIIVLLICLIVLGNLKAQDSIARVGQTRLFKTNYLTFAPFSLLNIEPAIKFGYEYDVKQKFRIRHDIGYVGMFNPVTQFIFYRNFEEVDANGLIIQTNLKIPFQKREGVYGYKYLYYGIDVSFKYLYTTVYDYEIWRMGGQYRQLMDIHTTKYVGNINATFGETRSLSREDKVAMDWYVGVGFRYKHVRDDYPDDADNGSSMVWYDDNFHGFMLMVTAGMRLNFKL